MTSKTTNKFSPEVRTRAVRMVLDHEGEHASRWAAVVSISAKIGCTPQTLHDWVKKAETDSGKRSGGQPDVSDRAEALGRGADLQGFADRPLDLPFPCRQARQSAEALHASEAGYGAEAGDRPRLCGELRGLWRAQGLAAIATREL